MPWTFAHPAAVLPLRRIAPSLNLAALMLGSLAPDFGYHTGAWEFARDAHTLKGGILLALPVAAALLAVFYLVRRPIWYVLPEPHRNLLAPLVGSPIPWTPRAAAIAATSLLLGTWSHNFWDSFTHWNGWFVERFPPLQKNIGAIGTHSVEFFSVLQHSSTLIGVGVLIVAYSLWVRRRAGSVLRFEREDRWRYLLLLGITLVSGVIAAVLAAGTARSDPDAGDGPLEAFAFYGAVYGACIFLGTLILVSSICYAAARKATRAG
jgi:hypothetical protein